MPRRPRPQTATFICVNCQNEKPATEFRKKAGRKCKDCENILQKQRYAADSTRALTYAKKRQAALREQHKHGVLPVAGGQEHWTCPRCDVTKPLSEFGKNKNTVSGLQPYCKRCMGEASKASYWKNRDQYVEKMRHDYAENSEKAIAYTREWQKAHPDTMRTMWATKRARKRVAFVEKVEYAALYERDKGICQIGYKGCRGKVSRTNGTIDHVIPLALGGKHSYRNTQLACRPCNFKKNYRGKGDQLRLF